MVDFYNFYIKCTLYYYNVLIVHCGPFITVIVCLLGNKYCLENRRQGNVLKRHIYLNRVESYKIKQRNSLSKSK